MKSSKSAPAELPIIPFRRQQDWEAWLKKNHESSAGVWMRLMKKGSGEESITYPEAVEGALCYGWIDGQKKSYDETSWIQKFTPRGRKSIWSKINREKVEELITSGRMAPAGLAAVESARADGRWDAAYESQRSMTVPDDFQAELEKSLKASAFFATLKGANRYAILFRIQTAKKQETRERRIAQFIAMLERGEKIHP